MDEFTRVPGGANFYTMLAAETNYDSFRGDVVQNLAVAHMNAIDNDTLGIPNQLNADQVRQYHEDEFEKLGLPRSTFGGNAFGLKEDILWYRGCE
jgi:hypothetical protein